MARSAGKSPDASSVTQFHSGLQQPQLLQCLQSPLLLLPLLHAVPGTWNLLDPRALHDAVHALMPGAWSLGHITRLSKFMPGGPKFFREDGRPELASTHPEEVAVLLKAVDLSWCGSVCDQWSGTGTIKRVLNAC